jgi:RNA polymerase sigma-70 factor (ECF subfamily)
MVGRTPTAARQLASRARRRIQGASPMHDAERDRQRELVAAFIAASREGSFDALLAVLAPDVVIRADATTVGYGAAPEIRGVDEVFKSFAARARGAKPVDIDGIPGAAWIVGGDPRVVFAFTVVDGKIAEIELVADPAVLAELHLDR